MERGLSTLNDVGTCTYTCSHFSPRCYNYCGEQVYMPCYERTLSFVIKFGLHNHTMYLHLKHVQHHQSTAKALIFPAQFCIGDCTSYWSGVKYVLVWHNHQVSSHLTHPWDFPIVHTCIHARPHTHHITTHITSPLLIVVYNPTMSFITWRLSSELDYK